MEKVGCKGFLINKILIFSSFTEVPKGTTLQTKNITVLYCA